MLAFPNFFTGIADVFVIKFFGAQLRPFIDTIGLIVHFLQAEVAPRNVSYLVA